MVSSTRCNHTSWLPRVLAALPAIVILTTLLLRTTVGTPLPQRAWRHVAIGGPDASISASALRHPVAPVLQRRMMAPPARTTALLRRAGHRSHALSPPRVSAEGLTPGAFSPRHRYGVGVVFLLAVAAALRWGGRTAAANQSRLRAVVAVGDPHRAAQRQATPASAQPPRRELCGRPGRWGPSGGDLWAVRPHGSAEEALLNPRTCSAEHALSTSDLRSAASFGDGPSVVPGSAIYAPWYRRPPDVRSDACTPSAHRHGRARTARAASATREPWSDERQAKYSAAVTARVQRRGGHGAPAGPPPRADGIAGGDGQWRAALGAAPPQPKYHCPTCSLAFNRQKQLAEHLRGKKHAATAARAAALWEEFTRSSWYSHAAPREWVVRAWSLDDFLVGVPRRSRGGRAPESNIAPHVTLSALAVEKRLQIWRYLRELMPSRPGLPEAFAALERRGDGRFARVKEILESCETFRHVEQCVLRSTPGATLRKGKVVLPNASGASPAVATVIDLACGHGLVGILLAYRFPDVQVVAVDLARRPAYRAFVEALRESGAALSNIRFVEGDFNDVLSAATPAATASASSTIVDPSNALPRPTSSTSGSCTALTEPLPGRPASLDASQSKATTGIVTVSPQSLVLCVHGCGPANQQAIELARRGGAPWLVVPCCLCTDLYLQTDSLHLLDDTRYAFLCGAMAATYGADRVASLDPRITPRAIVLMGGERDRSGS